MSAQVKPFLGVERSLTGRAWVSRLTDDRLALAIAQREGLPEIVARVLAARGIAPEDCAAYLAPSLKSLMPDPSSLMDMDKAARRIAEAIMRGEKVAVFGDYDVDGATSSALLRRFFRAVGSDLRIYIPDRIREGYGPNAPALMELRDEGIKLIITVDCGTMAHRVLGVAFDAGLEIVVVDHHQAEPALPPALALVNPNRLDDTSGQGTLAASPFCCSSRSIARCGTAAGMRRMTNRICCRCSIWWRSGRSATWCRWSGSTGPSSRKGCACWGGGGMSAFGRLPMWRGWKARRVPIISDFCSDLASMRAVASGAPISARGY
jgi:hypothetical protein